MQKYFFCLFVLLFLFFETGTNFESNPMYRQQYNAIIKSFPNDHYQCYNAAGFEYNDIAPSFTEKLPRRLKQHQQQSTESISEDTIHVCVMC